MSKKSAKATAATTPPLFVFGLDWDGKPRGAKFREIKDDIASVAMDMKFHVVVRPSGELAALGTKLPVGRLFSKDKLIVPIIRKDLHDKILQAHRASEENVRKADKAPIEKPTPTPSSSTPKSTRGLPLTWDETAPGDMVLMQESPEDGWWEGIVLKREGDLLTLRYRDFSGSPTCIRHISMIARVYPGPF